MPTKPRPGFSSGQSSPNARVQTLESQFSEHPSLTQVTVPNLWQQQAVAALREGKTLILARLLNYL